MKCPSDADQGIPEQVDGIPHHPQSRVARQDREGKGAQRRVDRRVEGGRRRIQADLDNANTGPGEICPALATFADASSRSRTPRRSPRRCRWWRPRRCARRNRRADDAAVCPTAVSYPAQATLADRRFTHPLLEVREVRKRAVILSAATKGCAGRSTATCFAWLLSLIRRPPCSSLPEAGVAVHRAHPPEFVAEFAYRGFTALC